MSKSLIILGNGFDLDLGWKTSFRDVFTHSIMKLPLERYSGCFYVKELIINECWCDFEGYLRKCVEELNSDRINELNFFWKLCRNNLLNYFGYQTTKKYIYQTNSNSCAYHFIKQIVDDYVFSFNYTNPFQELELPKVPIEFMHGKIEGAFNGSEIKVGIDNSVLNPLAHDKMIEPLIKSIGNDAKYRLLESIKEVETIVIYGHSLGITDSDYFKPIFEAMICGALSEKDVYFVTKDSKSESDIALHLSYYGISYDKLLLSNNIFHVVYTNDGIESDGYKDMLKKL